MSYLVEIYFYKWYSRVKDKGCVNLDKKQNDIMEEQRKAREEFIKLKKMQSGEIEPEAKPSEVAVLPKTFGEKFGNFWYHYKIHTILIFMLTILFVFSITQCLGRQSYDFEVMYFAYKPALDSQTDKIADYFQKYAEDTNGDGEVKVKVINCSVTDDNRDASRVTMLSKVQAVISSEEKVVVYIVDDKAIEYFDNAFDFSLFTEEPMPLGKDFYEETKLPQSDYMLPDGLFIGQRIIKGTAFEGNKTAEEASESAKIFMEKIKKQAN